MDPYVVKLLLTESKPKKVSKEEDEEDEEDEADELIWVSKLLYVSYN